MKKLVCLGLAALLAVQTTACGVNAQEPDTGNIVVEDIGEAEDKLPERNLKDDRLEQVTESGKLLIGISPDYAPFAFTEDSKDTTKISAADKETDTTKTSAADNTAQTDDTSTCVGSDVQLGEYIAKQLGVEPLFVEMEFDDCLKAAKEGTVDLVLLGMLPKNDRKASVDFTEEYYKPGKQVLLVTEEKQKKYKDLDAFTGKTVVAQYGTLQAQLVMEQMPETYMTLIDVVSDGIEMLRSGKADAVALDEAVAEDLMKEDDDLALSALELEYEAAGVVGGVVKDQKVFLDAVNKAIEEVKVQKLYYNWLAEATHQAAQKNPAIDDSSMEKVRDLNKKAPVRTQTPATPPVTDPAAAPSATDPAATPPVTDPAAAPPATDPAAAAPATDPAAAPPATDPATASPAIDPAAAAPATDPSAQPAG